MVRVTEIFEKMLKAAKTHEFLKTGFARVDEALDGGFLRKELIILGGFTGIGKSYLAGQWFYTIMTQGYKVAYFSLEISNEMVVSRIVGSLANIKPTRVTYGLLTSEEYKQLEDAKVKLTAFEELLSFYDDTYTLSAILKEIRDNNYDFIVVDFLQNVIDEKSKDEYSRLSRISLELQRVAKEKNCTILALSQLSNIAGREGSGSKTLEYKGSGSIAMVCDLGLFIERGELSEGMNLQQVKLSLRKNRRGMSGLVFDLFFKIPGGLLYEAA